MDVEMAEPTSTYFLSTVFPAHKSDVKCLQVTGTDVLISGGRDETVKLWAKKQGQYQETIAFPQPKGLIVNSVAYYENDDGWKIFVGRKDGSIAVYISGNPEPVQVLSQHSSNVCCLHVDKVNAKLLSGSWDNNVIIWPIHDIMLPEIAVLHSLTFQALLLSGHTMSVWALASIEQSAGYYLTGSADKTIKLWHDDSEVRTFTGHTDVVRALLVLSKDRFISAANDATVRMWHLETGVCLAKFVSLKDEFIFSLSRVGPFVISCGEGGHAEVWKRTDVEGELGLEHEQILQTPTLTAWTSVGLANDDFAIGGNDGRIYVFTQDEARRANPETVASMDAEIAARVAKQIEREEKMAQEEVVIKVSLDDGAPNLELRYRKGTDPTIAAEKFIQDNGLPASYLDEITSYIVANIPEARASQNKKFKPQPTQRVQVEGDMDTYDYAMEVTLEDGRQLLLPYNLDEDPNWAAQRFCEKHNLSMKFMQKLAQLLKSETAGIRRDGSASQTQGQTEFFDPFTGGGRYVPGGSSMDMSGGGADPLTGGGRYVPGGSSGGQVQSAAGADPYTSEGRYIPGSAAQVIPNSCREPDLFRPIGELMPLADFYLFGVEIASQKAVAKLHEVNDKQTVLKLSPEQLSSLEQLLGSAPGSFEVSEHVSAGLDIGLQWSLEDLVVILDLFRIALLHEFLNKYYCDMKSLGAATQQRLCALLVSETSDAIRILVCRSIANAFSHLPGRLMVQQEMSQLVQLVAAEAVKARPALQLAACSALCNWSYLLMKESEKVAELGPREDILRAIIKVIEPIGSFGYIQETAMIRLLQSIITLMWGDHQVIQLSKSRNLGPILMRMLDAIVDDRGKHLARTAGRMVTN